MLIYTALVRTEGTYVALMRREGLHVVNLCATHVRCHAREVGKCLKTPNERCTCQVRRLGSEGVGKTCPLFFWLGGALLDLIGGLPVWFGGVEPEFSKKKPEGAKMGRARKIDPTEAACQSNSGRGFLEPPGKLAHSQIASYSSSQGLQIPTRTYTSEFCLNIVSMQSRKSVN